MFKDYQKDINVDVDLDLEALIIEVAQKTSRLYTRRTRCVTLLQARHFFHQMSISESCAIDTKKKHESDAFNRLQPSATKN